MSPRAASPSANPTRRAFGQVCAAGGIFGLLDGTIGAEPEKALSVEEALIAVVRARYGKHLTAKQLDDIRRSLRRGLARADALARVPLTNADEPAFAFRADLP